MFYLYSKRGKLIGTYENAQACSISTGYSLQKIKDCLMAPGFIIGSCFTSPYRWRNTKADHIQYRENVKKSISRIRLEKVLKIMQKNRIW